MKTFFLFPVFCLLFAISAKCQVNLHLNVPQLKADTITAADLVSVCPDSNIVSFVFAARSGDNWVEVKVEWDKVPDSAKELILGLKPGARVFIEQLTASNKGQLVKLPGKTYIIKSAGPD